MKTGHYRIGDVARQFGISVRTIHHYEQLGLIPAGTRDSSQQRCYSDADVAQIAMVMKLKGLGFRLKDIGRAYRLCHDEIATLDERYAAKIELLQARRAWLQERIAELQSLLSTVDDGLAGIERARQSALAAQAERA